MTEKKPSYQDELFARVKAWAESDENRDDLSSLFDFVQAVALDSFKNGLKQGRRRAATPKASTPR